MACRLSPRAPAPVRRFSAPGRAGQTVNRRPVHALPRQGLTDQKLGARRRPGAAGPTSNQLPCINRHPCATLGRSCSGLLFLPWRGAGKSEAALAAKPEGLSLRTANTAIASPVGCRKCPVARGWYMYARRVVYCSRSLSRRALAEDNVRIYQHETQTGTPHLSASLPSSIRKPHARRAREPRKTHPPDTPPR